MKRDMELVRQVMLAVESWPSEGGDPSFGALKRSDEDIMYNIYQAIKAGLLDGVVSESSDGLFCRVFRLTPEGHDFLDNARNQFVWNEVMDDVKNRGFATASFEVVKRLLDAAVRKRFGLE